MSERIETPHLMLVPLERALALAVLAGDLSGIEHTAGWPHADTRDALAAGWPVWLVVADGLVIGDCGTAGEIARDGDVEIGLGLAAEWRGRGLGPEVIEALTGRLLARPEVRRVLARVEFGNVPSRRAFEKAGFVLERLDEGGCLYSRRPP